MYLRQLLVLWGINLPHVTDAQWRVLCHFTQLFCFNAICQYVATFWPDCVSRKSFVYTATTSTTSSPSQSIFPSQSPSPTVEPMSRDCVGVSQEAASAGRQDTSTAAIAVSALLAVLFLLTLLIISVLVLWVVRLNKQLASVKGIVSEKEVLHILCKRLWGSLHLPTIIASNTVVH